MPSKAELEQELDIAHAEYEQATKDLFEARQEIDRLRAEATVAKEQSERVIEMVKGAAAEAGVTIPEQALSLATVDPERVELEVMKARVEDQVMALDELRNPTGALLPADPTESALDIVRANQRERFELQQRSTTANTLLSRIAGLMNMDRWDEEGGELLLERLQRFSTLRAKLAAKMKDVAKVGETEYNRGRVDIIEWVQNILNGRQASGARDPNQNRRIEVIVSGNPRPLIASPDATVDSIRRNALSLEYPHGAEPPIPVERWLVYDESGTPVPLNATMRELVLPTERLVITTPVGVGA